MYNICGSNTVKALEKLWNTYLDLGATNSKIDNVQSSHLINLKKKQIYVV